MISSSSSSFAVIEKNRGNFSYWKKEDQALSLNLMEKFQEK
jgi:hypothetical protein